MKRADLNGVFGLIPLPSAVARVSSIIPSALTVCWGEASLPNRIATSSAIFAALSNAALITAVRFGSLLARPLKTLTRAVEARATALGGSADHLRMLIIALDAQRRE